MCRNLLLTGATGALGPHLAAELLAIDASPRITVLMRPPFASASQRFSDWIKTVATLLPASLLDAVDKLHPVLGDVSDPSMGIVPAQNAALWRETDVIIHAAADTRFNAPQAEQWHVNVQGTRHLLDWAARCPHLRQFILVSSTFVAGSRTGRIIENAPAEQPEFVTHYQRTKWEAEQLALASNLPVSIARISLVMGSHATGFVHRLGALHNLIRWFGRGLVPMLPGTPDSTVDIIAAETAAQCIGRGVVHKAGRSTGAGPAIWHIAAGRHAAPLRDLIDFVFEQFHAQPEWRRELIPRARVVDQPTFDELRRHATGNATFAQVMESVSSFLPDLLYPKIYDTTQCEALWGGPLPLTDWRETLGRVIRARCIPVPRKMRTVQRSSFVSTGTPS